MQYITSHRLLAAIAVLFATATLLELCAAQAPGAYIVKRRRIEDVPEALKILRRFLNFRLTRDERCERYAVLMNRISTNKIDQIGIAELGLAPPEQIKQRFNQLGFENLRQLYIDGVNAFNDKHVDKSMLDLVDCLSKFRTSDARARSFLNNPSLQETIRQYNLVMDQPLANIINGTPFPELTGDKLTPSIKTTARNIMLGDEAKVEMCFPSAAGYFGRAPGGARPFSSRFVPQPVAPTTEVPIDGMSNTLAYLYSILPLESTLEDRCSAYSYVLDAPADKQDVQLANEIASYIQQNLGTAPANVPLGNKDARDALIFALIELGPQGFGADPFVDLVDCLAAWQYADADVNTYLSSQELTQTLEALANGQDPAAIAAAAAAKEAAAAAAAAQPAPPQPQPFLPPMPTLPARPKAPRRVPESMLSQPQVAAAAAANAGTNTATAISGATSNAETSQTDVPITEAPATEPAVSGAANEDSAAANVAAEAADGAYASAFAYAGDALSQQEDQAVDSEQPDTSDGDDATASAAAIADAEAAVDEATAETSTDADAEQPKQQNA